MNRDTIIGFILIASILVGYSIWMAPSKEEVAANQKRQESISLMREQARVLDSIRISAENIKAAEAIAIVPDSISNDYTLLRDKFGAFASSSNGEEQNFQIENNVLKINVLANGGFLYSVELFDY